MISSGLTGGNSSVTGSYAVTTVYRVPWSKTVVNKDKTKGRKKTVVKIVHDIFKACSDLTDDSFWKTIFENCAKGKFPRGFSFKNGILLHKKGTKLQRVEVPDAPVEAASICTTFFKQAAGLMSDYDRLLANKSIEDELIESSSLENLTWKDIKQEKIRELLINDYIREVKDQYNLTHIERIELITMIHKGFLLKYFTKDSVVFVGGKVTGITGLIMDTDEAGNHIFSYDPNIHPKKSRSTRRTTVVTEEKGKYPSFISAWSRYLDALGKRSSVKTTLRIVGPTSISDSVTDAVRQHLHSHQRVRFLHNSK